MKSRANDHSWTWAMFLLAALLTSGCSGVEKAKPQPESTRVDRSFPMDVPTIMRGTIASDSIVLGYEPTVVHGYGLVVGLKGTGSNDIPPDVRMHMIQMASRMGVGSERSGFTDVTPEALVDSMDTAVVVVEGIIPPGAPAETLFDVRVFSHPASSTTSLEGGRLWTCELIPAYRPDVQRPILLPPTGTQQAAALATASGPIFINPFAEPNAVQRDSITRNAGRILNGGVAKKDMTLKLRLANPSHNLAREMQGSINTRFPQEPGQRDPTARGESDELIEITVPPSYRDKTDEFIEVLRHTSKNPSRADAIAVTIRRYLEQNPSFARQASLRWQAIGIRSLPVIKELYDYPEELPRLAALRAGAKLDDPLVVPHLLAMATESSPSSRMDAIELLAAMRVDPRIDLGLRGLLNDDDVEVRLAAYEALVERGDPALDRIDVDGAFAVDIVESTSPMIYITQVGQPRIALFGKDLAVQLPLTVSAWSNRLIVTGDAGQKQIEIYYREGDSVQGTTHTVDPSLVKLVEFLGHKTTVQDPDPGLGLTYSQVVGAIHQIWRQKYIKADFKAEQDRILAAIMRQQEDPEETERPEFTRVESEDGDSQPIQAGAVGSTELERLVPVQANGEPPRARPPTP
jgi:hypothetical protein